jgi:hypothetical protein
MTGAVAPDPTVGITPHIMQSLGWYLRTQTAPIYDKATGALVESKLTDLVPNAVIRPAVVNYQDVPTIDMRDAPEGSPYVTWFQRGPFTAERTAAYGGARQESGFWEIDIKTGSMHIVDYQRLQDWLSAFLLKYGGMDVYFWHYNSANTPSVSRGNIIATATISEPVIIPRTDIAMARGDDGWIVANFTINCWKQGAGNV